jgi:hypothetical protein
VVFVAPSVSEFVVVMFRIVLIPTCDRQQWKRARRQNVKRKESHSSSPPASTRVRSASAHCSASVAGCRPNSSAVYKMYSIP